MLSEPCASFILGTIMKNILMVSAFALAFSQPALAQKAGGSVYADMPADFHTTNTAFDYVRKDVMIPMRDGVKLHTAILIPQNARHAGRLMKRQADNVAHIGSPW